MLPSPFRAAHHGIPLTSSSTKPKFALWSLRTCLRHSLQDPELHCMTVPTARVAALTFLNSSSLLVDIHLCNTKKASWYLLHCLHPTMLPLTPLQASASATHRCCWVARFNQPSSWVAGLQSTNTSPSVASPLVLTVHKQPAIYPRAPYIPAALFTEGATLHPHFPSLQKNMYPSQMSCLWTKSGTLLVTFTVLLPVQPETHSAASETPLINTETAWSPCAQQTQLHLLHFVHLIRLPTV